MDNEFIEYQSENLDMFRRDIERLQEEYDTILDTLSEKTTVVEGLEDQLDDLENDAIESIMLSDEYKDLLIRYVALIDGTCGTNVSFPDGDAYYKSEFNWDEVKDPSEFELPDRMTFSLTRRRFDMCGESGPDYVKNIFSPSNMEPPEGYAANDIFLRLRDAAV